MDKLLILIRHGHRDTTERELDNGLTDKGREQARLLKKFFEKRFAVAETSGGVWVVSSPKRRCIETLTPLSKSLNRPLDVHPNLVEQSQKESATELAGRVQQFLSEWHEAKAPITVACSHGDWLPIATQMLLNVQLGFKKGAWIEIASGVGGGASLRWMVPSLRGILE